jgi:hypothetical protein
MNPHEMRMSLVEWTDRARFERLPNGKHVYHCPLCGMITRREDFEGYVELEHHLTDIHYDNIREIDGRHPHEMRLDSLDDPDQRTLENFNQKTLEVL